MVVIADHRSDWDQHLSMGRLVEEFKSKHHPMLIKLSYSENRAVFSSASPRHHRRQVSAGADRCSEIVRQDGHPTRTRRWVLAGKKKSHQLIGIGIRQRVELVVLWKHQFLHGETEIEHNRWRRAVVLSWFSRITTANESHSCCNEEQYLRLDSKYLGLMFNERDNSLNVSYCRLSLCLCQRIDRLNTWTRAFSFCLLFENETCFVLWISWSSVDTLDQSSPHSFANEPRTSWIAHTISW